MIDLLFPLIGPLTVGALVALAELLKMSGKPWSNPAMAAVYRKDYRDGLYGVRGDMLTMQATQNLGLTGTLVE